MRPPVLLMCLGMMVGNASAQSPAKVARLPEITITSLRGKVTTGKTQNMGTSTKVPATTPFQPVSLPPGTRLDVGHESSSHAIVTFPGVGGCMISEGSSLRLPEAAEDGMTVTFDRHIGSSPNCLFLNINAAALAQQGGTVFRTKNKFEGNSRSSKGFEFPRMVFTTLGGRFFILDQQDIQNESGGNSTAGCTVGVLDGSATVEELTSGQKTELKAGQVARLTAAGIGAPRAPTRAEQSFDIGCKLAVLGREAPAALPPSMKTVASTNLPGCKVNSLGMVFLPIPGTKILMCVHETRHQDLAAYQATQPPAPMDARARSAAHGLWGWGDHPVTTTWDEAQAFCAWLSQKEGRKYRLPTDEEWSHAAGIGPKEKRGPQTTPHELNGPNAVPGYPWGNAWPPPPGSGNLGDVSCFTHNPAWHDASLANYDDGHHQTAPVMSSKPNKLGIYDLAGNVAEWCEDWFNDERNMRVTRGGSWRAFKASDLAAAYRLARAPDNAFDAGFRVVLEQP